MNNLFSSRAKAGAVVLGIGLGGFFDGTVLHMILDWHQMVSNIYPPTTMEHMHLNMFWGGMFHAFSWLVTLSGIVLLWTAKAERPTSLKVKTLIGLLLIGWGLFNVVEGLIDHQILQLHHVREDASNKLVWDIGFLIISSGMIGLGWILQKEE